MMESKVLWMLLALPALGVLVLWVLGLAAVLGGSTPAESVRTARRWASWSIFLGTALFAALWFLGSEAVQQDALTGIRWLFRLAGAHAGMALVLWMGCTLRSHRKSGLKDIAKELIPASFGGLFLVVLILALQLILNSI